MLLLVSGEVLKRKNAVIGCGVVSHVLRSGACASYWEMGSRNGLPIKPLYTSLVCSCNADGEKLIRSSMVCLSALSTASSGTNNMITKDHGYQVLFDHSLVIHFFFYRMRGRGQGSRCASARSNPQASCLKF